VNPRENAERNNVEITVQLDSAAMKEATIQAMVGVLTPEMKAKLIEQAIVALLKPSSNTWNRNKSPIELAFEEAIMHIAREESRRLVAEDEKLRTKMKDLLRSTADKVLNSDPDKLAQRMADSFVDSLKADR
jgi:agmatine/peptidylarginine deiminase